jgi:hypothetical protein
MQPAPISPGDVVSGLEPDEHVEISKVTPFGARTLVEGVAVSSRRLIRRPLAAEELARLCKIRGASFTYDGNARAFLLGVEAHRIKTAYQFDPLFAVNSSAVDVLPHQVEAVYRYLLPLPRIRFLLADDTGAGKTIMAGLLLKELLFRGTVTKVLIVVPGGLTRQWVDEMAEKFGLNFRLINRVSFEAEPAQFARADDGLFVTSIDFIARHEGCLNAARETQWDMIIVDEAHKLSAYEYGIKVDRSERYQAVEALAPRTDHLLFLTATPHRGRKDTFRRLLMLLDEDLFQEDELVTERIGKSNAVSGEAFEGEAAISKARNRFFLRRLKEEMVDWSSQPLFRPRYTKTGDGSAGEADRDAVNAKRFCCGAMLPTSRAVPDPGTARPSCYPPTPGSAVLKGVRPIDVVDSAIRPGSGIAGVTNYMRQGGSVDVNLGVGRNVDAAALGVAVADRFSGLVQLAFLFQDTAKDGMRLEQVLPQTDGIPDVFNGLVQPAPRSEHIAKVDMGHDKVWIQANGLFVGSDSIIP